jgi:hypothetical protein
VQAALGAGLHLRRDVLAPVAAHLPGALKVFLGQTQPGGLQVPRTCCVSDSQARFRGNLDSMCVAGA